MKNRNETSINIKDNLHVVKLNKYTKKELIEYIIKSNIKDQYSPEFTCQTIKTGMGDIYYANFYDNRWNVRYRIYDYNTYLENCKICPGSISSSNESIKILREPKSYTEYLKQFGL